VQRNYTLKYKKESIIPFVGYYPFDERQSSYSSGFIGGLKD
jgi:hypothetical protein